MAILPGNTTSTPRPGATRGSSKAAPSPAPASDAEGTIGSRRKLAKRTATSTPEGASIRRKRARRSQPNVVTVDLCSDEDDDTPYIPPERPTPGSSKVAYDSDIQYIDPPTVSPKKASGSTPATSAAQRAVDGKADRVGPPPIRLTTPKRDSSSIGTPTARQGSDSTRRRALTQAKASSTPRSSTPAGTSAAGSTAKPVTPNTQPPVAPSSRAGPSAPSAASTPVATGRIPKITLSTGRSSASSTDKKTSTPTTPSATWTPKIKLIAPGAPKAPVVVNNQPSSGQSAGAAKQAPTPIPSTLAAPAPAATPATTTPAASTPNAMTLSASTLSASTSVAAARTPAELANASQPTARPATLVMRPWHQALGMTSSVNPIGRSDQTSAANRSVIGTPLSGTRPSPVSEAVRPVVQPNAASRPPVALGTPASAANSPITKPDAPAQLNRPPTPATPVTASTPSVTTTASKPPASTGTPSQPAAQPAAPVRNPMTSLFSSNNPWSSYTRFGNPGGLYSPGSRMSHLANTHWNGSSTASSPSSSMFSSMNHGVSRSPTAVAARPATPTSAARSPVTGSSMPAPSSVGSASAYGRPMNQASATGRLSPTVPMRPATPTSAAPGSSLQGQARTGGAVSNMSSLQAVQAATRDISATLGLNVGSGQPGGGATARSTPTTTPLTQPRPLSPYTAQDFSARSRQLMAAATSGRSVTPNPSTPSSTPSFGGRVMQPPLPAREVPAEVRETPETTKEKERRQAAERQRKRRQSEKDVKLIAQGIDPAQPPAKKAGGASNGSALDAHPSPATRQTALSGSNEISGNKLISYLSAEIAETEAKIESARKAGERLSQPDRDAANAEVTMRSTPSARAPESINRANITPVLRNPAAGPKGSMGSVRFAQDSPSQSSMASSMGYTPRLGFTFNDLLRRLHTGTSISPAISRGPLATSVTPPSATRSPGLAQRPIAPATPSSASVLTGEAHRLAMQGAKIPEPARPVAPATTSSTTIKAGSGPRRINGGPMTADEARRALAAKLELETRNLGPRWNVPSTPSKAAAIATPPTTATAASTAASQSEIAEKPKFKPVTIDPAVWKEREIDLTHRRFHIPIDDYDTYDEARTVRFNTEWAERKLRGLCGLRAPKKAEAKAEGEVEVELKEEPTIPAQYAIFDPERLMHLQNIVSNARKRKEEIARTGRSWQTRYMVDPKPTLPFLKRNIRIGTRGLAAETHPEQNTAYLTRLSEYTATGESRGTLHRTLMWKDTVDKLLNKRAKEETKLSSARMTHSLMLHMPEGFELEYRDVDHDDLIDPNLIRGIGPDYAVLDVKVTGQPKGSYILDLDGPFLRRGIHVELRKHVPTIDPRHSAASTSVRLQSKLIDFSKRNAPVCQSLQWGQVRGDMTINLHTVPEVVYQCQGKDGVPAPWDRVHIYLKDCIKWHPIPSSRLLAYPKLRTAKAGPSVWLLYDLVDSPKDAAVPFPHGKIVCERRGWACAFCELGNLGGPRELHTHYAIAHAEQCWVDLVGHFANADLQGVKLRLRVGKAIDAPKDIKPRRLPAHPVNDAAAYPTPAATSTGSDGPLDVPPEPMDVDFRAGMTASDVSMDIDIPPEPVDTRPPPVNQWGEPAIYGDDPVVLQNKYGLAGPILKERYNQWTDFSSRVVPNTLADLIPELDKLYDGGRQRYVMRDCEEANIWTWSHISDKRRFIMTCWNRWRYEAGPLRPRNRDDWMFKFADKYAPIMRRAEVTQEWHDHIWHVADCEEESLEFVDRHVLYFEKLAKEDRKARGKPNEQDLFEEAKQRISEGGKAAAEAAEAFIRSKGRKRASGVAQGKGVKEANGKVKAGKEKESEKGKGRAGVKGLAKGRVA